MKLTNKVCAKKVKLMIAIFAILSFSENVLFFGCRNKNKDFLCSEEWSELVNKGLLKIVTAFSRDQVNYF